MSQQDGFSGGFLLGTLVGGVVGGVVGALLTAKQFTNEIDSADKGANSNTLNAGKSSGKKRAIKPGRDGIEMETARRSLEDKIAQLNEAIDDVRQQLGGVNGGTVSQDAGQQITPPDLR